MQTIDDIAALETHYGTPGAPSLRKVVSIVTPLYAKWIERSRLCVISTVGPDGTDGSPRGDDGPVAKLADPGTLLLPDWRGNNRLDTLRNIVRDGRVSLMFMVPGSHNVVRVNGNAVLTADAEFTTRFEQKGRHPTTVIVVSVAEVYSQCARALMRANVWDRHDADGLPTAGELLAEATTGEEGGPEYDKAWPARAAKSMW